MQEYTKEAARELCQKLGIEWDETTEAPTVDGKPLTANDLTNMFPETKQED